VYMLTLRVDRWVVCVPETEPIRRVAVRLIRLHEAESDSSLKRSLTIVVKNTMQDTPK
jgi:hypothetical protein